MNAERCVQSKAAATKEDLMTRLSNAVKQRDAAREEALLAAEKLNKLQEDLDAGLLQQPAPAAATPPLPSMPSAGQAAALTPPAYAGGATEPGTGPLPTAMRKGQTGALMHFMKIVGLQ